METVESLGYTVLSVTADGFSGIRSVFKGIPFQMCQVHMERLVVKGTTRNPQLEAGQVLLALVKTLHDQRNNQDIFRQRLLHYKDKYWDFLQEKTESLTTGERWFTHDDLRKAFNSLYSFFPHLFTYKHNALIPRTTNSLEGHFSHVRDIVHIHRSLTRKRTEKVLDAIMLCSTIAPTEELLKKTFK
jgi:Transposase IS66 family